MSGPIKCAHCGSTNTRVSLDEEILDDGDESLHVYVWCLDCLKFTDFPEDLDWREYS